MYVARAGFDSSCRLAVSGERSLMAKTSGFQPGVRSSILLVRSSLFAGGGIGNTPVSETGESTFEPWPANQCAAVSEWLKGADCKSAGASRPREFESRPSLFGMTWGARSTGGPLFCTQQIRVRFSGAPFGFREGSSTVERLAAKQAVAGSSPVPRCIVAAVA